VSEKWKKTMMDSRPVLEINALQKQFYIGFLRTRVEAVRSVSFTVREGEIFGLLGPNGAGKTTIIKTVMSLIRPSSGAVRIYGRDARHPSARRHVGYLPETPYFQEYLTPKELLVFHGRLAGLSPKEAKKRRDVLIEKVGLRAAANRSLRKFSKGMLQRIGIAQALVAEPKLLILDEPMSGLDPVGRRFMVDLMTELNKNNTTIVFSSHILSDVERLCRRVVILNKGVKTAEGAIDDLLEAETEATTFEDLFMRKAFDTPSASKSEQA
jgi:ABC-2 type transport system ATP-binding protein